MNGPPERAGRTGAPEGAGADLTVLLATHDGTAWLPALLASLEAQTAQGWRLVVRDDGSKDATPALLEAFRRRHPDRVALVADGDGNLGARGNFARLLTHADTPYAMCCDQDDVWLPGKIEATLGALRRLEAHHGAATPLLVHTDARVVAADLAELAPSLWRLQGTDPRARSLARLLVQNGVTGCTVALNRALLQAARPVPAAALMHDWWLALVAAALGHVEPLPVATLLYRQHGGNDVGARRHGLAAVLGWPAQRATLRATLAAQGRQAAALRRHLEGRLSPAQARLLEAFAGLEGAGWARRRWLRARHGFRYAGLSRNVALALFG